MIKQLMAWVVIGYYLVILTLSSAIYNPSVCTAANSLDYQAIPPFISTGVPPLVMLVMGRNHKLYYEAYNDASDLNGDGDLDVRYNPDIDYYGYFDSNKYYEYNTSDSRFDPVGQTADKTAPAGDYWSGDFLNYLTMTRMDCLRKVLYGGYRSTDTSSATVLERVFVPQDAHSWGKEYHSFTTDGYDIQDYTPLDLPKGGSRHLFASTTLSVGGDPLLRVLENSAFRIWEWVAIERPVAGSEGNDGTGRRAITDNDVTGGAVDITNGGAAGTADDSYAGGAATTTFSDNFNDGSIGAGWVWKDHEGHSGTSRSESGGKLWINAAGADVWTGSDQFGVLYRDNVSNDFDFILEVDAQQRRNGWGKAGIMVRNNMDQPGTSTGYLIMAVTPDNGHTMQWDNNDNGYLDSHITNGSVSLPNKWVRMTKVGSTFTGYKSNDGSTWTVHGTKTMGSANAVQDVGIFVTSHNSGSLSLCEFDQMELTSGSSVPDPDLAFDDDTSTRWRYPDEPTGGSPVWIEFDFGAQKEIKSYTINGDSDAPDDWTLEGSNDQVAWDTLHTVSGAGLNDGVPESFTNTVSGLYQYYRLVFTNSSLAGTAGIAIREIEMMETTEPIPASATLTDYDVRVKVCDATAGLEDNSKLYPSGSYKPIGILQRHGESDQMYFGLMTGSYTKNTSGGVLRKNIRSIRDEINTSTGEFLYLDGSTVNGIIETIDKFKIVGFDYGSYAHDSNCGWITTRAVNEGECRMWGNPVAEMMYEGLRYFSGAKTPTAEFTYGAASNDDNDLGLPKPDWLDPYTNGEDIDNDGVLDSEDVNGNGVLDAGEDINGNGILDDEDINGNGILDGYEYCAKPFMLVLSDINPTYDSDQLPGSDFPTAISTTLTGMDVANLANTISTQEGNITTHFIGESASYDGACTPKAIAGFGEVRGLCPEEPTKQGSYYASAVSYHGRKTDLHATATSDQKVTSYSVGLASPLPKINITVGTQTITVVPFAKSVGGFSISSTQGDFQPTNTIVDFFVETITSTYGKFRINFEDVEQGADHDMDAIVEYIYEVQDASGNPVADPSLGTKVNITLNSTYAAGSIMHHLGYIISGTTKDGTYLEVRDEDTAAGSDPDYFLDTPPGVDPGGTWNDSTALPLTASRDFFPGTTGAATLLTNPLWYAAKWGGFEDYNANDLPDLDNEWDADSDGIPDTYFYVQNPLMLETQLNRSFADILRRTASGTAASVISHTRSGEGAVHQAVFFPEYRGPLGNSASWVGELHSMFVDSMGNMREDTDGDAILDTDPLLGPTDRVIVMDGTTIHKYNDSNGDSIIEAGDTPEFIGSINDINYLWSSSEWLNEMTDAEAMSQRTLYDSPSNNRYIFTFIDEDEDMVVDGGEQQIFACEALPAAASLTDTSTVYPYLTLFPTFSDEPDITYNGVSTSMSTFRTNASHYEDFLINQTSRVMNYIRGVDQDVFVSNTSPSYTLPAFRTRKVDYDNDGFVETWRLGDIVYSTPTEVGRPSEGYHLLYRDASYAEFYHAYRNRRHVVYTGANDGMFHAFNAGFYDANNSRFVTSLGTETAYELGQELWAYVPYNLLPHLYWLTEASYPHVYYCDAKPKVFDAKVFPDDTHYIDGGTEPNWGTILVSGMRFGGGEIVADMDKDGAPHPDPDDRTMSSAFFILNVTNPEEPPEVIAELSFPGQGYTTCYPAVIPMKDKITTVSGGAIQENEWYLVFGSGPASITGTPDINGPSSALSDSISQQKSKLFIVDLKELVLNGNLVTMDNTGTFTSPALGTPEYVELDNDAFISDPIAVDFNLNFSTDALYFGSMSGDSFSGWGGKFRRVVIDDDMDPANWTGDSTLMDLDTVYSGEPVSASPTAAVEGNGERWIFWGTGRYYVRSDAASTDQQSYYGIQEPYDSVSGNWTWDPVVRTQLIDQSTAVVWDNQTIENVVWDSNSLTSWETLIQAIDTEDCRGWYVDFDTGGERNLGQAALLGELLTFTTYIPSTDLCSYEGESYLYALYYKTGTPYFRSVIGTEFVDKNADSIVDSGELKIKGKILLGRGLAATPNIHVGSETGSKAFVQTSTGEIQVIEQINPGATKSGVMSWREQ